MKKSRKNRTDILIDVTSYLDVVFIILLIVIAQLNGMKADVRSESEEAEQKQQEAQKEQKLYSDLKNSQQDINQYVEFISVVSTYDPVTLTDRSITIHFSSDDREETLELKGEAVDETYDQFTQFLKDHIDSDPEKMTVLSLNENDEDILYRDEKRILSVFDELSTLDHAHVRVKFAPGGDV